MTDSPPPSTYDVLKTLLDTFKDDLARRMDGYESRMEERVNRIEEKMDRYVLEAVFQEKLNHLEDKRRSDREAWESALVADRKERDREEQKTRWLWGTGITLLALVISIIPKFV